MKTELSKYDNRWYNPGKKTKIILWYFINVLFIKNSLNPLNSIKIFFLRLFGAKIGERVFLKPSINIKYPWLLEIGNDVWIGENVWIDNLAKVKIGNNVCISQGALILCGNHNYKKTTFDLIVGEIVIEDGVWVGANSVVCGGVTLASHSILTVSSVATNNLEAYTINQGNPAKKNRDRKFVNT